MILFLLQVNLSLFSQARNIIKIDWHALPQTKLKKAQVPKVGFKDGF